MTVSGMENKFERFKSVEKYKWETFELSKFLLVAEPKRWAG